jgi:hypothetical protein
MVNSFVFHVWQPDGVVLTVEERRREEEEAVPKKYHKYVTQRRDS